MASQVPPPPSVTPTAPLQISNSNNKPADSQSGPHTTHSTSNKINPGSFYSILPLLENVLKEVHDQSTSQTAQSGTEASDKIAGPAKDMYNALEGMKKAALAIPGGDISREEMKSLEKKLEEEAESRRLILRSFLHSTSTIRPNPDSLAEDDMIPEE